MRRVRKIAKSDYSLRNVCPHGTTQLPLMNFREIYLSIYGKSVEKIQVSLKSHKNNGYFTRSSMCIAEFRLELEFFSVQSCTENQTTLFMFRNFFRKNHVVYEIMWKNIV